MDHPTDRDYRNLEERNAAYWRELVEGLMLDTGTDLDRTRIEAAAALAEYNASK
jgi:hypothetical protein